MNFKRRNAIRTRKKLEKVPDLFSTIMLSHYSKDSTKDAKRRYIRNVTNQVGFL